MGSTTALVLLAATAVSQGQAQNTRFDEISVERINIVEQDGRVRMVLANDGRQADAVIDGRVLASVRDRPAGTPRRGVRLKADTTVVNPSGET